MPLRDAEFYLGDVPIAISAEGVVSIPVGPFLQSASHVLSPETIQLIESAAAGRPALSLDELRATGIDVRYNSLNVELTVAPSVDQRARGEISLYRPDGSTVSANARTPAGVSGYINTRFAVDYVSFSETGETGIDAPRVDFEAAARISHVVLESEATLEGDGNSVLRGAIAEAGFHRRGSRLVYDIPDAAVRLTAGDVDPWATGYQVGSSVLGLRAERNYGLLQPNRNIRPTGKRSFRIERPSNVTILVDNQMFKQVRLQPGDYDLNDLPLKPGANGVTLVIEDDVGNSRKLEFTAFLGRALLAPGIDEWSAGLGFRSTILDREITYDFDAMAASAFYRRGLSEDLTGEIYGQADAEVVMGGVAFVAATPVGLASVDTAASQDARVGQGFAVGLAYELPDLVDEAGWRHSLRAAVEYRSENFSTNSEFDVRNDYGLDVSAQYSRTLPWDMSGVLSARYAFSRDTAIPDRYGVSAALNKQIDASMLVGLTASYDEGLQHFEDGASAMIRFSYRPTERSTLEVSHDTRDQRSAARYTRYEGEGVGSWNADASVENEAKTDNLYVNGGISYVANRAKVAIAHTTQTDGLYGLRGGSFDAELRESRTTMRLETAIAFADGRVAIGRPVGNGFAIVDTHDTLEGRPATVGRSQDRVEAQSDGLGPALVPEVSAYSSTRLQYDVDDLPLGYDLGSGAFDLFSPYKAGYALEIGSAYTVTAYGTLVGADGEVVALTTGTASPADGGDGPSVPVFTNRAGRFAAQGLAPGRWLIVMEDEQQSRFHLEIPEQTVGLFDAGSITTGGH